jgi:hypothetical protein
LQHDHRGCCTSEFLPQSAQLLSWLTFLHNLD